MRFQPGQSGNPSGRPKRDKIWRDALLAALDARIANDPDAIKKLADKLCQAVDDGDIQAIKELADRLDGKVPQAHIGGDEEDAPIRILHEADESIIRRYLEQEKKTE